MEAPEPNAAVGAVLSNKASWAVSRSDCIDFLSSLPDGCIQCAATSPPYWGLRDYGVPPRVWGGDPSHAHEWGPTLPKVAQVNHGTSNSSLTGGRQSWGNREGGDMGSFCACGAWRGCLGLEPTPWMYVEHLVEIFRELKRVLRPDGVFWLNLGDTYAANRSYQVPSTKGGEKHSPAQGFEGSGMSVPEGLKPKDLIGIPWRVAFALQADGWWLRSDVVWAKPNAMPEPVSDRLTKAHEYVFLMAKSEKYFFDVWAIKEPAGENMMRATESVREDKQFKHDSHNRFGKRSGNRTFSDPESLARIAKYGRSKRTVWEIPTHPFPDAHFAVFPESLIEPMVKAGTSERGCCPECGVPWTRVLERTKHPDRDPEEQRRESAERTGRADGKTPGPEGMLDEVRDAGWKAGCAHGLEPIPCIVADPFTGSGTTGVVATKHGRRFVGSELSDKYAQMAGGRIGSANPLFARGEVA